MSLIRQVWLLVLLTLFLAFVGGFGFSMLSARHFFEAQLSLKNQDRAVSLAQILAQKHGGDAEMAATLNRQFDLGADESLRLVSPKGVVLMKRDAAPEAQDMPAWFVRWTAIRPALGRADVMWADQSVATIEVQSQTRSALQELMQSARHMALAFSLLALGIGAMAYWILSRIRQPLEATVKQALALTERRFITVREPAVPELANLSRAMNLMVDRLRAMFEEQSNQVEQWRRQANNDPLTGVSNRGHFMARLKGVLNAEDGSTVGILVLLRVIDLQGLNRRLGRLRADALLAKVGEVILAAAEQAAAFEAGRLSGSDFAVLLTDATALKFPSNQLAARLREQLQKPDEGAFVVVSAVRWWPGASVASLLAAAEHALARAEKRGPSAIQIDDSGDGLMLSEQAWEHRLAYALLPGRPVLVEFPLVNSSQSLLRLECSLRLRWEEGADPVATAVWLPVARRAKRTAEIDLGGVSLALEAIDIDSIPRSLRINTDSLSAPGFFAQLDELLGRFEASARGLCLEVDESLALRDMRALNELAAAVHSRGARLGLEHAGEHMVDLAALLEVGLDSVKLDASLTEGLAKDEARSQHVAGSVRMLHGIGLRVYAEVDADPRDALALWGAGVDGVTGSVYTL